MTKQALNKNRRIKKLSDRYVLPTYARLPIALDYGKGAYVWDVNGKRYLDFFAGLAVNNLGNAHPIIRKVLNKQAGRLLHCSNVYLIEQQALLAKRLVELTGLNQVFFCNSGAESVEACIKFVRYWGFKKSNRKKYEIIVAKDSFHGRTLGALSATSQKPYRLGFNPLVSGFKAVPFNDIPAMKGAIGPKTCAVMVEPVQGEGGLNVPSKRYLKELSALCRKRNVLLVLDEVQVGIGRTGQFLASQHYGVKPDLLALSKALGSGFPIGACVVSKKVAGVVQPGMHASTFGGNPLACSVALETLSLIGRKSFLKSVRDKGKYFRAGLIKLQKKFPIIKEVRGVGLMIGCELSRKIGKDIVLQCLEKGLMINAIQNKILRFVPPLIVTKKEIDKALGILEEVLDNC